MGVGYATYLYATTIGTQNGLITTGVIGGVLLTLRTGRGAAGSQATPAAIRSVGACRRSPRLGYYGRDAWSEEQLLSEPYRHVFFHPHAESGGGIGRRNREAESGGGIGQR